MVGRPLRSMGTRPILVAEIQNHFEDIRDSCLIRWSQEIGGGAGGAAALAARMRDEYARCEAAVCAACAAGDGSGAASRLRPHRQVIRAIQSSGLPYVYVLSGGQSEAAAAAALVACGLDGGRQPAAVALLAPQPLAAAVMQVAAAHATPSPGPDLDEQAAAISSSGGGTASAGSTSSSSTATAASYDAPHTTTSDASVEPTLHVVVDRPSRLDGVAAALAATHGAPRLRVHTAEWHAVGAAARARLAMRAGASLLADWQLAELLGVSNVDAVMDCVAWRS